MILVWVFASHPLAEFMSQSKKFAAQLPTPQRPITHDAAVTFGGILEVQLVPHVPQLEVSTLRSTQSP